MEIRDIHPGQQVEFWSERVFGVPAHDTVKTIGRKVITLEAWYGFTQWTARVHVERIAGVQS